jgi:hypothetical protein
MSDGRVNSSKRARRNRPFLSIRARLIVLALLAMAPLMLARMHELESARLARLNAVNAEVIDLARRGVESQRDIVYSVRALLQIVSRLYARIPLDTPGCNEYIADLTANIPWIRSLSIASTDGRINCSSESLAIGLNLSDRRHFRNALTSREFALSDYLIDRLDHVPSLVATLPIIKDDGSLKAMLLRLSIWNGSATVRPRPRSIRVRRSCCSIVAARSSPVRQISGALSASNLPVIC